jgi:hypothetical protein
MIGPGKRRQSAEYLRALCIAIFGEDWEVIMAHELHVDPSIVGRPTRSVSINHTVIGTSTALTPPLTAGHLGYMPKYKATLSADEFAEIAHLAFHETWQKNLATGMRVDSSKVKAWAKVGTPEDDTQSLRTFIEARSNNTDAALSIFLEEPLKPWERGARILSHYELITDDPTMIYGPDESNTQMLVRAIADLIHYGMDRITTTGVFIDLDAVVKDAIALYMSDPEHSATPIAKSAKQSQWKSFEFIPYILTEDSAKIAAFTSKFDMTQDQAVDDLIETTDWGGQDLPHLVGNNGTPAERLAELLKVLRAAGKTEDEY